MTRHVLRWVGLAALVLALAACTEDDAAGGDGGSNSGTDGSVESDAAQGGTEKDSSTGTDVDSSVAGNDKDASTGGGDKDAGEMMMGGANCTGYHGSGTFEVTKSSGDLELEAAALAGFDLDNTSVLFVSDATTIRWGNQAQKTTGSAILYYGEPKAGDVFTVGASDDFAVVQLSDATNGATALRAWNAKAGTVTIDKVDGSTLEATVEVDYEPNAIAFPMTKGTLSIKAVVKTDCFMKP
jgi:hypothetical protein